MTILMLSLLFTAAIQQPPPPPQPPVPRDAARIEPVAKGTAIIRGRVTDRETGQPIPRANVSLMSFVSMPDSRTGELRVMPADGPPQVLQARTNADGRYEFKDLPAGRYRMFVNAGDFRFTYLNHSLSEGRPIDNSGRGPDRPFTLADGEIRENADVALWRAFAIEGRVVDEFGDPMGGVEVFVKNAETGQREGMRGPYQVHSDDRGLFRVFGLGPGRYAVCANPRNFSGMPGVAEVRERHIETCYPAAVIDADAQPVAVSNADVGGVEIRVQRSRAFTASGMAVDSSGTPLTNNVGLERVEGTGSSSSSLQVRPDGTFIARGLTPGDYAIRAEIGSRFNPDDTREREFGYLPFRIENEDIEGLVVTTRKASKVNGRVVFEEGAATQSPQSLRVMATPDRTSRQMMMGPPPNAAVKPDLTFELSGLFGPVAIMVNGIPRGWIVRTIRYKTQDVTDTLIDFTGARDGDVLEILLSNRGARVSGRVIDDQGSPAEDVRVMLLPADPARWTLLMNTFGGGAGLKPDGSFQLGPVRPGEYLIAAIGPDEMPRTPFGRDYREYFERIASVAQRITLTESDQQVIDLRVTKLR